MYFKLFILLISFILTANTAQHLTKDQVLKLGFEKAKESFHVAEGKGLSEANLVAFVGPSHSQKVHDFFNEHSYSIQKRNDIQLPLFEFIISALNLVEPLRNSLYEMRG
ncbi:uncharacterized protein LOC126840672 [Adelges cooleyi]|uniref:uncharacterized protein LOC126840672 n=1 Tax=Adelges cooleyi TaxID=133065 RepID=UPI00217F2CCD|nr:uncharacterized protein LOC126840672 [Adelges cooleyi]